MWTTPNGGTPVSGLMPQTNLYNAANQRGDAAYDAAGNQLTIGGTTLTYDAENRVVSASNLPAYGGGSETYVYDGDGRRVQKIVANGPTTTYVHDIFGKLIAEYSTNPPAPAPPCHTCYISTDHLGSTRLVTGDNATIIARHDYAPFGEEIPGGYAGRTSEWGAADNVNQKFTGKERDSETGLDYFGARYMSSVEGRFLSPDPHSATALHLINPQRWNGYGYGLNSPLLYTDPTGQDAIAVGFSNEIPLFGHAGIISLHQDGTATYARYGPVTPGTPLGQGKAAVLNLPKVVLDDNGVPTQASFELMAASVAKFEGEDPSSVKMAFFKTSEVDTIALDNWISEQLTKDSLLSSYYSFIGNSCADFCERGLMVARVPVDTTSMSVIPNLLIVDLQTIADAKYDGSKPKKRKPSVTSKVCYTDEKGKEICQH